MGLAGSAACAGDWLWLGGFGCGRHGRVPVNDAAATVAGEQLAFAELIPHLGPDTHAAAYALLIVDAGQTGSAGGAEAIEAGEPFGLDERAEGFALGVQSFKLSSEFPLAVSNAGAGFLVSGRLDFNLAAGPGEGGLLGFSTFEAGELLVFEAFGLAGLEVNLVLDGGGLFRSLYGVELGAESGGLLAVFCNLALEAGAERFLAAECVGGLGCLVLGGSEGGTGLDELSGQCARLLSEAGSLQLDSLQFYEVLNQLLHPCQEGYVIGLVKENGRERCCDN